MHESSTARRTAGARLLALRPPASQLRKWRRDLHAFDPQPDSAAAPGVAQQPVAQAQAQQQQQEQQQPLPRGQVQAQQQWRGQPHGQQHQSARGGGGKQQGQWATPSKRQHGGGGDGSGGGSAAHGRGADPQRCSPSKRRRSNEQQVRNCNAAGLAAGRVRSLHVHMRSPWQPTQPRAQLGELRVMPPRCPSIPVPTSPCRGQPALASWRRRRAGPTWRMMHLACGASRRRVDLIAAAPPAARVWLHHAPGAEAPVQCPRLRSALGCQRARWLPHAAARLALPGPCPGAHAAPAAVLPHAALARCMPCAAPAPARAPTRAAV